MKELFINGERVDVMPGDNITLQYRSNWFGELKEISGSNSLTISLPRTPTNDRAFGFAAYPDSNGSKGNYRDAILVRNGVEIVRGMVALLTANENKYEVCLVWGNYASLQKWVSSELSLKDLKFTGSFEFKPKNEITLIPSTEAAPAFGYIDYYSGGNYINPSFNCGNIFYEIIKQNGLNVDLSKSDISPLYNIYLPVVEDLSKMDTPTSEIQAIDVIPGINQLTFFNAMCRLLGLFCISGKNGSIRLLSFDVLKDKSEAIDLSDRLASYGDTPGVTAFEIDGYEAYKNWIKYTSDNKDSISRNGYADYYLTSGGNARSTDKTIYTMPFTIYNSLIQYVGNEFVELKNTLKQLSRKKQYLSFEELMRPLFFETIIPAKYAYFQQTIKRPIVITVTMRLSEIDIQNLDYAKPIYLSRFGCFFAIVEISNEGELSEVKLIKLA